MKGKKKMKKTTKTTKKTQKRVKEGLFGGTKGRDMAKIWKASKIQRKRASAAGKPLGTKELVEYMKILNRQARRIEAAAARIEKAKKRKAKRK